MQKRILVTGGTGYIGSHTVVELMNSGYEPILIDNLYNSQLSVLDGIEGITGKKPAFENIDLREFEKLQECCKKYPGIEAIIHFAALKAVGESVEKPLDYYGNNLVSMINILRIMKEFKIPSLVFSSSCTVYGQPDALPVTELSPIKPANSPYGNTKQISEEIIRDTITAHVAMKAISLRYFNPVGAHPSALIGELPLGTPQNLVPYITQTVIGLREVLNVFGNDYKTPDGTGIRDYIYVVDLAKAHVVAINRLVEGKNKKPYEVFNLGTGKGLSVLEVIHGFEKATGQKVNFVFKPRRPGDIASVYADTSLANNELGWKAASSIEDTLKSAWNWEKRIRKKE
jgi:UDP-glucose 4-epimerase